MYNTGKATRKGGCRMNAIMMQEMNMLMCRAGTSFSCMQNGLL